MQCSGRIRYNKNPTYFIRTYTDPEVRLIRGISEPPKSGWGWVFYQAFIWHLWLKIYESTKNKIGHFGNIAESGTFAFYNNFHSAVWTSVTGRKMFFYLKPIFLLRINVVLFHTRRNVCIENWIQKVCILDHFLFPYSFNEKFFPRKHYLKSINLLLCA